MIKTWKAICLTAAVALVLALGIWLVPPILTNHSGVMAVISPPSPPPPGGDDNNVSWLWDFGDGQTSRAWHPSHFYEEEGLYQVTLTVTDAEGKTVTHYMDVIADAGAAPARLTVRNLQITPVYSYPNQTITIRADVFNSGGSPGSQRVSLVINGQYEQGISVGVSPGTAYPVSFTVYKATPGTYQVTLGDAVGWFYIMYKQQ